MRRSCNEPAGFGTGLAKEARISEAKVNVVYFMTRLGSSKGDCLKRNRDVYGCSPMKLSVEFAVQE
jgi:hypothetical protein